MGALLYVLPKSDRVNRLAVCHIQEKGYKTPTRSDSILVNEPEAPMKPKRILKVFAYPELSRGPSVITSAVVI